VERSTETAASRATYDHWGERKYAQALPRTPRATERKKIVTTESIPATITTTRDRRSGARPIVGVTAPDGERRAPAAAAMAQAPPNVRYRIASTSIPSDPAISSSSAMSRSGSPGRAARSPFSPPSSAREQRNATTPHFRTTSPPGPIQGAPDSTESGWGPQTICAASSNSRAHASVPTARANGYFRAGLTKLLPRKMPKAKAMVAASSAAASG
jgi:hypothetical protein